MSSISSVGSTDPSSLLSSLSGTRRKKGGGKMEEDFAALQKALDSGNLADAKTAFSTIQTAFKNGPGKPPDGDADDASPNGANGAAGVSGLSPKGPDLSALQKALDSGDLSAAKTALTDLKKNAPKHHHHGGGTGSADGVSGSDSTSSIDALLQALQGTGGSNSSSSSSSSVTSADASGNIGKLLDLFAS